MKQLIPFALLYFIYDFIKALLLVEGGFAAFTVMHWIMAVMVVIFIVLLFVTGKDAIADAKQKKAEQEQAAEKERQEILSRRRSMYELDEDDTIEAESAIVEVEAMPSDDEPKD